MKVRIRRLRAHAVLPRYESSGAAAFDLAAAEEITVAPGEVALVPTGLVIEVPAGFFLAVFARSSTPMKRGLMVANGVGVVDPDYSGPDDEVKIAVFNFTRAPVGIARGDRIAQGIFLPSPRVEWVEVEQLRRRSRGGFGATGERIQKGFTGSSDTVQKGFKVQKQGANVRKRSRRQKPLEPL